ncbi:hypothetical protein MHZ36_14030, partial [Staphylococcus sp. ACRSN]|nr:hypothetical protein [Staphylococcus sp. ACRSN]
HSNFMKYILIKYISKLIIIRYLGRRNRNKLDSKIIQSLLSSLFITLVCIFITPIIGVPIGLIAYFILVFDEDNE